MSDHGREYAWCPNCDKEQPTDLVGRLESYVVRGKSIVVPSVVRVCRYCGRSIFDGVLEAHNLRQVYETYNRLHPDDPIPMRETLGPEPPLVQDMRRALLSAMDQDRKAPLVTTVDAVEADRLHRVHDASTEPGSGDGRDQAAGRYDWGEKRMRARLFLDRARMRRS